QRILRLCQGMQVDDTEDAVEVALQRHPIADGAEIVAEMQIAGRLDAGEDAIHVVRPRGLERVRARCYRRSPRRRSSLPAQPESSLPAQPAGQILPVGGP